MEPWREELYHSTGLWKKHKYIRKEGGRYIYKESQKSSYNAFNELNSMQSQASKDIDKAENNLNSYIWDTPDSDKGIIGKGYSRVMRFLNSGKADEQITYWDADGTKHTATKKEAEEAEKKKEKDFAKRWARDSKLYAKKSK